METEKLTLNAARGVTLTAYLQQTGGEFANISRRPAVLILPGGGYSFCSEREADPIAFAYLGAGYQAFILRYSVRGDAKWPNPLDDYEAAMELIRANAEKWHVLPEKTAVVGFSAGGHLAACAATMAKNRPAAAVLGYAVTQGSDVHGCNFTAPDTVGAVDADTCPCFVFASSDDRIVPVANSTRFVTALAQHGVRFECHIYSAAPHGFSTAGPEVQEQGGLCARTHDWVAGSIGWLREIFGDFAYPSGMTPPACGAHINGDSEPYLSADCTLARLFAAPGAQELLAPLRAKIDAAAGMISSCLESESDMRRMFYSGLTLRDAGRFAGAGSAQIDALDAALRRIPNAR
jgi:acetyl esterase/lipase